MKIRKKKLNALLIDASRLRVHVEQAAQWTNSPEEAREFAAQWYTGVEGGGKSATFGLISEGIAGILLAAHESAPQWFDATLAAEAVGLSCALTGEGPDSLRGAAERWRPTVMGKNPSRRWNGQYLVFKSGVGTTLHGGTSDHRSGGSATTITAETVIDSPRCIADGRGAWRGTVREAVHAEYRNPEGTALGNLEAALREEGKLPELPEEDPEDPEEYAFDVDRHAHLLTIGHLRDLLDDPNATIVQAGEE